MDFRHNFDQNFITEFISYRLDQGSWIYKTRIELNTNAIVIKLRLHQNMSLLHCIFINNQYFIFELFNFRLLNHIDQDIAKHAKNVLVSMITTVHG